MRLACWYLWLAQDDHDIPFMLAFTAYLAFKPLSNGRAVSPDVSLLLTSPATSISTQEHPLFISACCYDARSTPKDTVSLSVHGFERQPNPRMGAMVCTTIASVDVW